MEYPLHPLPGEEDHGRSVEDDPHHADEHAEGAVQPVLHLAAKEEKEIQRVRPNQLCNIPEMSKKG